ncbi:uncharacterized protein [Palaemon carinicauda]|uniref:uncharacterized protein n=1 Tax=Palaemon carinicauda TaxID=392227 RepID=UPI0035B63A35
MIEHFHRALKAALISRCTDSSWFTQLPCFLLGLRTSPKDALDVSAAEMMYGDPLIIPAEFFPSVTSADDLQRIRHVVGKFTPCRQIYKPPEKHHITTDLPFATHVFPRNVTSKPPLTPLYTSSFLVIRRNPKAFLLKIRGQEDWVCIDRLKPASLLPDDPPKVRLLR